MRDWFRGSELKIPEVSGSFVAIRGRGDHKRVGEGGGTADYLKEWVRVEVLRRMRSSVFRETLGE